MIQAAGRNSAGSYRRVQKTAMPSRAALGGTSTIRMAFCVGTTVGQQPHLGRTHRCQGPLPKGFAIQCAMTPSGNYRHSLPVGIDSLS